MSKTTKGKRPGWAWCGLALAVGVCFTGCQVRIGGQTLPSPYYQYDDVQYFPPGPEFILQREADFLEAQNAPPAAGVGGGAPGAEPVPAPNQP